MRKYRECRSQFWLVIPEGHPLSLDLFPVREERNPDQALDLVAFFERQEG